MDQLETPVALFVFNRPETTKRVLDRIGQARPRRLFVIADGPRPNREEEARQCQLARDLIGTINWPCDVATNYSAVNLGCGKRMSSGISWVFEQTPEAIFLEDDCVPSLGFFAYCSELLGRYREDPRIGMISGDCFLPPDMKCSDSYYFSRYPQIWGWASWRRAWAHYEFDLTRNPLNVNSFVDHFGSSAAGEFFFDHCIDVQQGRTDTWDYQVTYSFVKNSLLAVIPSRNLVSNIGFGTDATHTRDTRSPHAGRAAYEPDQPLQHAGSVSPWDEADRYTEKERYGIRSGPDPDEELSAEPGIAAWHPSVYVTLKKRMESISGPLWKTFGKSLSNRSVSGPEKTTAVVIDPGLTMEGGHNYSALLRIRAELSKLDVAHTCIASMTADSAVREVAMPVLPTKGLWWRLRYTHSEYVKHVRAMRDQLSLALNEQTRPPDLLILPCCDAVQVHALAAYYAQPSSIPTPHLLMWLLFRPNHFRPIGDVLAAAQIDEYREAFNDLRRAIGDDRKISILCEVEPLAAAYRDIIGLDVDVAPCPNLASGGKKLRQGIEPTLNVVTLGHANQAKGYHLLPDAIKDVLRADSRASFFVHGTLQNADTVDGTALFDALSSIGSNVITSNEVLTPTEYLSRLLEADILLLPYDEVIYETRGSGLFNEAREIGIPVVATGCCAFARPAFDEGWGVEIGERSGRGIAQAILAAFERLPDLSARAQEAAHKHRANDIGTILPKVVATINRHERAVRAATAKRKRRTGVRPLPDAFFSSISLQDGASIRDEASTQKSSCAPIRSSNVPTAITLMKGRPVDTTTVSYCYSVVLSTDIRETWNRPPGSRISADMSIEVAVGKIAVAWVDEKFQLVDGAERYAPAMLGPQRLVVPVRADRACFLVFRNFSPDASQASFRILGLKASLRSYSGSPTLAAPNPRIMRGVWTHGTTTRMLPGKYFTSVHVQEGAAVRHPPGGDIPAASIGTPDKQYAPDMLTGAIIDTTATPYSYSVVFDTDARVVPQLSPDDWLVAEIHIEAIAGTVGALWIDESYSVIEGTERYASGMRGIQRLVVPAPASPTCRLVLRNWASDSVPAAFRILGVSVEIHSRAKSQHSATGNSDSPNE